jgi:hypothetical protein
MLAGLKAAPRWPGSFRRAATKSARVRAEMGATSRGEQCRSKWSRLMRAASRVRTARPARTLSSYSVRNSAHAFLLLLLQVPASSSPSVLRTSFSAASLPRAPGPQLLQRRLPSGSIQPAYQLAFSGPCFFTCLSSW